MKTDLVVHATAPLLAEAVAARLLVRLIDVQAARGEATLVLTGGRIASAVYRAVAGSPFRQAVDWSRVSLWWGDERFLPAGHPDRNETQARQALAPLPFDPTRVHPIPAAAGPDDEPELVAACYAEQLAESGHPSRLPHFDLVLLSVGEDGHVASIFPGQSVGYGTQPVWVVRGAPKPPPIRITLTRSALNTAEQLWLLATGPAKAGAVGQALAGAGPTRIPAAGVRGADSTLWLLDRAAATQVPPQLRHPR